MPEEFAPLVLDFLPTAVIAFDREDLVAAWNRSAERLFGWTAADALGQPLRVVPPDGHLRRLRWLERAAAGEEVEVTTQRIHRDGRTIDVIGRYGAMHDAEGNIVGFVAEYRDASAELRAATRLQRSQAQLALIRRLASLVQRMIQDLDLPSVLQAIVEVGVDLADAQAGAVSLEVTPGNFARVANFGFPGDLTDHPVIPGKGLHGEVIATGKPRNLGDYNTWDDALEPFRGRGFHASLAVPISRHGRVIGALSVHSSLPRRQFDEEEIDVLVLLAEYASVAIGNATTYRGVAAEREKFTALVEAMPDGLAVVEDGQVTAWNATATRLTGTAASGVLGGPPPIDLDAAAQGVEITGADGRSRWIETVASDLPEARGRVYLIRDMTEQRDLERAKDLFFATTSHELKTPLTVVKGLAATLRNHWERMTPADRVESLATIERRAENLDRLIERILVGSRVQAGAFEVTPTPVDVGHLVTEMVTAFSAATPSHQVRAELPPNLPLVAGDRQAIDTILGHLLENAIKYSPGGGDVTVSASYDSDHGRLVVRIDDDGIGIDGDIERLLSPFVQADSRSTRRFGGVGLGLYIVRQLVDALGGELWGGNRPPGGASFAFSVPCWPSSAAG